MQGLFGYIIFFFLAIVILLVMIVIHEFGHYIVAKALKFKINEFSIGFGPQILSKTNPKSGEKFSLRAIPFGGYCAFEDDVDENGNDNPRAFNKEKPWKRILVLLSGGTFNLVSAFIFTFVFILVVGASYPVIGSIATDAYGNAYNPSLLVGDKIIAVNYTPLSTKNDYSKLIDAAGDELTITVIRDGESLDVVVTKQDIVYEDGSVGYGKIGFTVGAYEYGGSLNMAFTEFVPYTFDLTFLILKSLWMTVSGQIKITEMTGTVGTIDAMAKMAQMNWRSIFLLLPLLASNLGIFNLLPIPALDGSKVVFTLIEWIRKKPINKRIESYIHTFGLVFLLSFVVVIDILHFVFT
jgi:regulator of sigma E protease